MPCHATWATLERHRSATHHRNHETVPWSHGCQPTVRGAEMSLGTFLGGPSALSHHVDHVGSQQTILISRIQSWRIYGLIPRQTNAHCTALQHHSRVRTRNVEGHVVANNNMSLRCPYLTRQEGRWSSPRPDKSQGCSSV
jgi:hypothetical protein